jgi:AAA domain
VPANSVEEISRVELADSTFEEVVNREVAARLSSFARKLKKMFLPEPQLRLAGDVPSFANLDQLKQLYAAQPANYVVEGLLTANEVHGATGDSGLGKTPWAYQLGLCVASGKPFLDFPVKQGRVLYFDGENGTEQQISIIESLCKHLGIDSSPENFLVRTDETEVLKAAESEKPSLIIFDTLRAFYPEAESSNEAMASLLNKLRCIAQKEHCAILLLHHPRKPSREYPVRPLEDTSIVEFLNEASGARAFINQTTTRIGFDRPKRGDAAFVMKFHIKTKSPSESIYVERVLDESGEARGYRRLTGITLLNNIEQQRTLESLPHEFTFKEAKQGYGKSDDPTNKFLKKCEAVGLIEKVEKGRYRKLPDRETR